MRGTRGKNANARRAGQATPYGMHQVQRCGPTANRHVILRAPIGQRALDALSGQTFTRPVNRLVGSLGFLLLMWFRMGAYTSLVVFAVRPGVVVIPLFVVCAELCLLFLTVMGWALYLLVCSFLSPGRFVFPFSSCYVSFLLMIHLCCTLMPC